MASVKWNPAAAAGLLFDVGYAAVSIEADRIVEAAKPLTRSRTTRPPGRKEAGYSDPAGRLERSIHAETSLDGWGDPVAEVYAISGLGTWRNIGGLGEPAYGNYARGNNPALWTAMLMQEGTEIW